LRSSFSLWEKVGMRAIKNKSIDKKGFEK